MNRIGGRIAKGTLLPSKPTPTMLIQLFTHKLLRNYLQGLGKASASLIIQPCLPKNSLFLPCKLAFSTLYLSFGLNIMSPATYNISLSWWLGSWSNNHLPSLLQNDESYHVSCKELFHKWLHHGLKLFCPRTKAQNSNDVKNLNAMPYHRNSFEHCCWECKLLQCKELYREFSKISQKCI